jgi:ubiquinone/menaquinone biosynthesis C-methylase UbiE
MLLLTGQRSAGTAWRAGLMRSEQPLSEHAVRAACTYGAAADHYGHAPLGFWDRYGSATVSRLPLAAGDAVLDLCCGAGASAIPAARAVGPAGHVLGIDVARPLLEMARAKAAREGLGNIEFGQGDATCTGLAGGSFDAVVCVFGVFFAPDMAAFVAEMWRLVRPGGVLAITTWGQGLWEPASTCFWESVRAVEPSLFRAFSPWDEITTPQALTDLFARGRVANPVVAANPGQQHLDSPDMFWDIVLGTGYRATIDALSREQRTQVRRRLLSELRSRNLTTIRTDVVFGTATRTK